MRLSGTPATLSGPWSAGIDLLDEGGARILKLARLGTIPFLLVALWLTFALAGGRKRPLPAFLATALVATYPPLLGHAGLATTDIAAVATALGFLRQDIMLLQRELRARRTSSVHYGLFAIVNPCDPDMPKLLPLAPGQPATGWIVLSEQFYRSGLHFSFRRESCAPHAPYAFHQDPADAFDWLRPLEPVARIGASLRLYYVAER